LSVSQPISAPRERPLRPTGAPRIYAVVLATGAIVAALDQITKQLALDGLAGGKSFDIAGGIVTLRLTFNSGGAFGLGQGLPELFLVATVVIVGLILVWVRRLDDPRLVIPLGLVLGGGIGNAIDRIARDTGGRVVDFVDLHVWPVFNLADASITTGVVLLLWMTARSSRGDRGDGDP
jgi:signal peptidase II